MAVYNLNNYLAKDGLGFPLNFRRGNPNPLDNSSVWNDYSKMATYAKSDATAYVGQILSLVETVATDDSTISTVVSIYSIQDESGTLKKVGTSSVGDESTITVAEDGTVSLYGIKGLALEREEEDGIKTAITYQPLYVNGKLTWVELNTTTVEELATEIESLKSRLTTIESIVGKSATDTTEATGLLKIIADNTAAIVAEVTAREEADKANKDAIDVLTAKIGTVEENKTLVDMIADAQAAATYDDTQIVNRLATAESNINELQVTISGLTGAMHFVGKVDSDPLTITTGYNAGDVVLYNGKEYVFEVTNADNSTGVFHELGDEGSNLTKTEAASTYETKEEASAKLTEAKLYADNLATNITADATSKANQALTDAKAYTDEKNTAMDTRVKTLEDIGAEKNIIDSVDTEQFFIDNNRNLTLLDIAIDKVTGLQDTLDNKVDKVDGYRLISPDESIKLEKLVLNDDGTVEVSGEVSAANVKELDTWITTNRNNIPGLLSTSDAATIANLKDVEAGAEVNDIVTITIAGSEIALPIVERNVDIPGATAEQAGVVRSSTGENKVSVAADNTMEVNSVNVDKLVQTEDTYFVLNGGTSASVI